jgi:outer membrane protein TolC
MAVARYTSQVGTAVDVLDASVSLSASKNQMVDAVYDTRKAWADMMFAIGKNIQTQEDKR